MIPNLLDTGNPRHREFENAMIKYLKVHVLWRGKLPRAKNFTFGRIYTIFLCIWFPIMHIGVFMYLNKYKDGDIYALAGPLTDAFLIFVMEMCLILCQTKIFEEQMERYYNEIHLSNYRYHDELTMQVLNTAEDRCMLLFRVLNRLTRLAPLTYGIVPLLVNIASGAFTDHSLPLETSQYILLPFEYKYDTINWIYASIIFAFNTTVICYFILFFILFMLCIIIHLLGHVDILKYNLESLCNNMDKNKVKFSKEEDNYILEQIKRIIDHHNSVWSSLNSLKHLYGPALFVSYIYDVSAICILMLVLFQNLTNFIRYGSVAVVVFLKLVGMSYAYDQLSNSVEELHDTIASVPWYAMSRRNQRAGIIMIIVSRRPFALKALGIVRTNLNAMAAVFRSFSSYGTSFSFQRNV